MTLENRSPRVTELSWGQIAIEGERSFKDAKLYPGGAREWDWNETGTRHVPGVQSADVQELIDHGARVIVIGKGMYEQLRVSEQALELLKQNGIATHILQTKKAVEKYNELRVTEPVGGLFHTTC
ncbi:MAG: Mth938-like domain-containing protein [Candidatus Latescibacterota bacterium]|nr:MAG: Mth938-like domain-containing protein [Candidatus Latescibacterota bacterium]